MSIESIREHNETERWSVQERQRIVRALLKVAEAAAALAEDRTTKEWLPLLVALTELEAQE